MTRRLVVFPNDPIYKYYEKGEIKPRYYNPGNFFHEVHLISLCDHDIEPEKVQMLVGNAELHIHAIGKPSALTLPFFPRKVVPIVRAISPHLIRGYGAFQAGMLAVNAGRKLGIPTAISLHNDHDAARRYSRRLSLHLARLLEYYAIGGANKVICVSNYLVRRAQRYGARDIAVIYNKVYVEQFRLPDGAKPERLSDKPTILSVGRLDPQKYQECLIRAIRGLNVTLVLIGDGILYDKLRKLARQLGVAGQVTFIKSVPNQEIPRYYWAADIFAMATHYEGFCIPVLEAMAAGLPVVVCDTEPLSEILADTGLVVEKTPTGFREAFVRLLAEPQLRQDLGAKARARAVELDGSITEQKEVEVYQAIMEDGSDKKRSVNRALC